MTAARSGFTGSLRDWNGLVPFVVKLRSHAESGLPQAGEPPTRRGGSARGTAPPGWTHRVLSAGRGLLLVDGVDELAPARRPAVRDWLRGLLTLYPGLRTVVTSRPAAVDARWLTAEDFAPVTLSPMAPDDLRELVRHWHSAVRDAGDLPCPVERLPAYEGALLARLESNPHLRALAATPLLAAMLCALNLDRARQLPRDRMGIYAAALELIDGPAALDVLAGYGTDGRKEVQDELITGWEYFEPETYARRVLAEAPWPDGEVSLETTRVLPGLPRLRELRSLRIRSHVTTVDLAFLRDVPRLEELTVYSDKLAGHDALLAQEHLRDLVLETVDPAVHRSVVSLKRLRCLVLWARDVMVLDELADLDELESLSLHDLSHGHDLDFLSAMAGLRSLTLSDGPRVDADRLRPLRGLRHLTLVRVRDLPDLSGIAEVSPGLEALQVVNCERLDDLPPLAGLVRLKDVNLSDTKGFRSLAPLAGLIGIDELNLLNTEVDDLSPLSTLRALRTLNLARCENVRDLTPLATLTNLVQLDVRGIPRPLDLALLSGLPNLRIVARTGQNLRNSDRRGSPRRILWDKGQHRIGGYYTAH